MLDALNDAWAAGFIDGEGCFQAKKHSNGKPNSYCPYLTVSQKDKKPLIRLQEAYGGSILFVENKRQNQSNYWRWTISSAAALREVLPRVIPFLTVKQEEAKIILEL